MVGLCKMMAIFLFCLCVLGCEAAKPISEAVDNNKDNIIKAATEITDSTIKAAKPIAKETLKSTGTLLIKTADIIGDSL